MKASKSNIVWTCEGSPCKSFDDAMTTAIGCAMQYRGAEFEVVKVVDGVKGEVVRVRFDGCGYPASYLSPSQN